MYIICICTKKVSKFNLLKDTFNDIVYNKIKYNSTCRDLIMYLWRWIVIYKVNKFKSDIYFIQYYMYNYITTLTFLEWVIDCCLTPNEQVFSYITARTSYIWWGDVCFVLDQHDWLNFTVLAYWNNSLQADMSLHSDTLSRIRAMKSWLLLLNIVCLAEKQQIPILLSLVWPEHAYHYTTDAVNFCLRHTSNWNHMFVVSIMTFLS